jgi:tetratricopeptide (TPR) repeat protein
MSKDVPPIGDPNKENLIEKAATSARLMTNISVSILKVVFIILLICLVIKAGFWANSEDNGITIEPFETSVLRTNLSGISIAQKLNFELQDIRETDEQVNKIGIPSDITYNIPISEQYKLNDNPAGKISTQAGDFSCLNISSTSMNIPLIKIGTIGVSGSSISIGNLILFIKNLQGKSPSSITGSLQKYGSTIILTATIEDFHSNDRKIKSWEVKRTLARDNSSVDELIPSMVRELAFKIALYLGSSWGSSKNLPKRWESLEYLTTGERFYINYNITYDISDLKQAKNNTRNATKFEFNYRKPSDLLLKIAFSFIKEKSSKEAEDIFQNISKSDPIISNIGLGLAYSNEGNYPKANLAYSRTMKTIDIQKDPKKTPLYVMALVGRSISFFSSKDYDNAIKDFENAINICQKDRSLKNNPLLRTLLWNNKGVALTQQDKYDEAVQAYDRAVEINPQYADAWNNKGIALLLQGKYDEAVQAYDNAIEINPQFAQAWNNKGVAFTQQDKYDEALQAYDQAIDTNPQFAKAWNNKGLASYSQGKYDEAVQAYNQAIEINPQFAKAWNNKGLALLLQGKYDEAVQAFDRAIEINPQFTQAWNNKGLASYSQGKYDEAVQAYDRAIGINPQFAQVWNNKGLASYLQGKYGEALQAYDQAIEINPQFANAWYNKGIVLRELNRNAESMSALYAAQQASTSMTPEKTIEENTSGILDKD